MEILSTHEHIGAYILLLSVAVVLAIFCISMIILVIMEIKDNSKVEGGAVIIFLMFVFLFIFSWMFIDTYKEGVGVSHKVIITDFNKVYEEDYRITGQDGAIYIIEKAK